MLRKQKIDPSNKFKGKLLVIKKVTQDLVENLSSLLELGNVLSASIMKIGGCNDE